MERNDYKPLTDDELRGVFLPRDKDDVTYLLLREQARRANALARVLQKYHFSSTFTWHAAEALDEALAAYLGETP